MRATATGGGRRVAALGVAAAAIILGGAGEGDWPSFRGAGGAGVADGGPTVTTWNVETGEHVRWKTPIPGLAHSSPVIAGDRLFVTTAVREGDSAELTVGLYGDIRPVDDEGMHAFKVYCLDRATGAIRWERTAIEAVPKIKRHPKGSHAASSPATDGRFVVAFFGSEGLYCYDVDGDLKWSKDLGVLDSGFYMVPDAQWGFASSPIIHGDMVILQCDVQKDSFLAALKLETGEELWRTPRDEVPTWATPTVDVRPDRKQVICNGWKHIGGYDLETGEALWSLRGGGDIPVPRPVVAHDLVYITNAHGMMAPIYAIRLDASGELELSEDDPRIAWMYRRRGNYMQTPIVVGDLIFFCSDGGVVSCYDAKDGTEHFRSRLSSGRMGFTASPVAADGKVYYTSETGEVHVIRAAPSFEALAVNQMGVECMATPAVSGRTMYWRTRDHVVAIGAPE